MTERPKGFPASGFHFHVSRLLVISVIAATAATGALIVTLVTDLPPAVPPPGPNGMPPPPPSLRPLVMFPVVTGFFVLSWLAVLVIFSRDQILQHLRQQTDQVPAAAVNREELTAVLADLRTELAGDRAEELRALGDRLAELTAEFGERRETDGYLHGMRTAAAAEPSEANVRSIRRPPTPR